MQLAVLSAVVSVVLLSTTLHVARRRAGALVSPFVPALAFVFVGLPTFVYVTHGFPWGRGGARWAPAAFHDVMVIDAAAAATGIGAAVAALLVLSLRQANHLRVLPVALPCAMLGLSLTSAARHAESIYAVGYMPFYDVIGRRELHVGRERDVSVALMRPPQSRWIFGMEDGPQLLDEHTRARWSGDEKVHVRASSAGPLPFEAVARSGPVTMRTRLSVRAVTETASPLLSLRVGDELVYRVRAHSSDGALLYFVNLSGGTSVHEVVVEVVGTREHDGLRTFLVEVRREGSRRVVEVVAVAGETRLYDAQRGVIGEPIVAASADLSRRDPVPCSFALLGATHATCQRGGRDADAPGAAASAKSETHETHGTHEKREKKEKGEVRRPPAAFAAAAPAAFELHSSSTGGTLVTALLAVATVGLVILPDGSTSSAYTLVSTKRGPIGAPEAPPG